MSYLHLPSTAVGDTTPIDDPSNCECGGKGCDCPCHIHTRDNTTSDADLERDEITRQRDVARVEREVLRGELAQVAQRWHVEVETLRTELAATMAGADHLQTSLTRANARIADLVELLRMAGVTP